MLGGMAVLIAVASAANPPTPADIVRAHFEAAAAGKCDLDAGYWTPKALDIWERNLGFGRWCRSEGRGGNIKRVEILRETITGDSAELRVKVYEAHGADEFTRNLTRCWGEWRLTIGTTQPGTDEERCGKLKGRHR